MANSMLDDFDGDDDLNTGDDEQEIELENEVQEEELEEEAPTETTEEETPTEDTPEEVSEEVHDETVQTEVEETVDEKIKKAFVPLAAAQEERFKRQSIEAERDALKKQLEQYQTQQETPAEYLPDPYLDPMGYMEAIEARTSEKLIMDRVERSMDDATREYGEDVVSAARAWGAEQHVETNGWFTQKATQQRDPARFLVEEYKKSQKTSELFRDEQAYMEKWARDNGWAPVRQAVQETPVQVKKTVPARKPSLAELESIRGGAQDESPASMLD